MAVLTIYNIPVVSSFYGEVTRYTSSLIRITDGASLTQNYYGNGFDYSYGAVVAGTVTRIDFTDSNNGGLQYELTGLSHDAATVYQYVMSGYAQGLNQYLLNGNDTINGSSGNDLLYGYWGSDLLVGGAGNDTLDGGGYGGDTLIGGAGDDLYLLPQYWWNGPETQIVELANGGHDTVHIYNSIELPDGVEDVVLQGAASLYVTGNELDNLIVGTAGNNRLLGGGGNDTLRGSGGYHEEDTSLVVQDGLFVPSSYDTLIGGAGDDHYVLHDGFETIIESAGQGYDRVFSDHSFALPANFEELTLGGVESVNGTGNGLANLIRGNAGDNVLVGGGGADTLEGGLGNDTYVIDALDTVIDTGGQDTIKTSMNSYVLAAGFEHLTLTGSGVEGTGNAAANMLIGNAVANILTGEGGNDTLDGGDGADTLSGGSESDLLYGGVGNDSLDGGTGSDFLYGGAGDDSMVGGHGNDLLDGGTGSDSMAGGIGNDIYVVDSLADVIVELAGEGTDTVRSAVSYTLSAEFEHLELTGKAISGTGNQRANKITGNDQANVLTGEAGSDTMIGGNGGDTYYVNSTGDVVVEEGLNGTDHVISSVSVNLELMSGVENLTLTGSANRNAWGNDLYNVITGNNGSNTLTTGVNGGKLLGMGGYDTLVGSAYADWLDGGAGADSMTGGEGNDTYVVNHVNDVVVEVFSPYGLDIVRSSISYTLPQHVEQLILLGNASINATGTAVGGETLTGNAGNNVLDGAGGQDNLVGGAGNDTLIGSENAHSYMYGGLGDDTYVLSAAFSNYYANVFEFEGEGVDTIIVSGDFSLWQTAYLHIENLTLTGEGVSATGNSLNNLIVGNAGANELNGMDGADTMQGGEGNDTYYIDDAGDVIIELDGGGIDTVIASGDLSFSLAGTFIERLYLNQYSYASLNGIGNSLDNFIRTGAGNNFLDGGAGADTLQGGVGDDVYIVDNVGDIVEDYGWGVDTVRSSLSNYALTTSVENLELLDGALNGAGNYSSNSLTGNALDNYLEDDAGADTLDGGAGNDTMAGGFHGDIYYVRDAGDLVVEIDEEGIDQVLSFISDYALTDYVENGRIMMTGSANLAGNAQDNLLEAGQGSNVMNGGDGADTLSYQYGATSGVTISLANAGAQSTGGSGVDTVTNFEHLVGSQYSDWLTGSVGDNRIEGGSGHDTLNGGAGNDTMVGGGGNDTYHVRDIGDSVVELAGGGTDMVRSYIADYTLADYVEQGRIMNDDAANMTGNVLDNVIFAGLGNNLLDGGDGVDTLSYLYGATASTGVVVSLLSSTAQATEGSGSDTLTGFENLTGSDYADKLTGDHSNNVLNGGNGNDTLVGNGGSDTLTGGLGNDIFDFNAASHSGASSGTWDVITDFISGQDVIDLATIDANVATAGVNDVFTFIGSAAFSDSDATGQLRWDAQSNMLYGSTDADGAAEFKLKLLGVSTLAESDFIL